MNVTSKLKQLVIDTIGIACLTLHLAPLAAANPVPGHDTIFRTGLPKMVCQVFSADSDTNRNGASVDCQAGPFPGAPAQPTEYADGTVGPPFTSPNQAKVDAAGKLTFFTGNIGMGSDDQSGEPRLTTLDVGKTYHLQGWTIQPTKDGVTFTNDTTGRGMLIGADQAVTAF